MRCPSCTSENPETTKFCGSCGRPLTKRCGKCGTENPPQFKFCGECGSALIDAAASGVVADTAKRDRASDGVPEVPNRREGERRHLTVLFCDLVGSTEIAAQLDPEEWRDTVAGYQRAAAEAINRFGGHVAKYLGDGVMAFFGYPEAHDNDAERASRAGLGILDAIAKLNEQSGRHRLLARVGIDSGAVVVGVGAGEDADVFGDVPNVAARAQAAAEPDTVLITSATHRLISGLFVVEASGAQQLKGVASPVDLYRVIRPTGVKGRLAAARALTPFVGREEELRLLLSRWERARRGDGQVALVVGEAGIGKSRLVAEFHHRIRETPHTWMESAGEQFFENTPFHAFIEMLSQWLELQGGVSADERLGRLERAMASAGLKPAEAAPLVADLLQLPAGDRYPALTLTSEQKRRRLLAALTGWVFGAGQLQPVVMVVEDLHWLDPSTLELQEVLANQGATAPLMLLYTARPEFRPPWPLRSHHTQITLNRLSARNVREMIAQVAARKALAGETVDTVVERTGGVPLFVEELTRALVESGSGELSWR
jgi:class 3 adenylate cyclase